jgi:hypothetical protein
VEQGGGGNQGSTVEASILSWLGGANPRFGSLMIAANAALPLPEKGEERADALLGIGSAVESCQRWMADNPCPDAIVGDRFHVIVARFRFVALVFDVASNKLLDAHLAATVDRLEGLNAELRVFSPMCGDA